MLRGTVREVHALGDVSVTVDAVYGEKSLIRMKSRVNAAPGDRVFVDDVSPSGRAHDWVVIGGLTEIGGQATPAPHEHPVGQVVGLKDWLTQYEAWMGDHTARLDAADKRIAEGKVAVDQARADLTQAQTDIADAVRRVAIQRTDLDAAVVRLDQTDRNVAAAGTRISANETALGAAQKRIESAETTIQTTNTNLGKVDTRLTTTAGDLSKLQTTVGDVQSKAAAADLRITDALTKAGAAQTSADGKNRITRATSPASQPGTAVGDTHFTMSSMGGGGVVTRQQRWDGSTWQDEAVGHQVLASLDLGKATVGELDGIRIKARTIGVEQLTVGLAGNLIVDPNFNDPVINAWRLAGRWSLGSLSDGTTYFTATSNGSNTDMGLNGGAATGPTIPVTAGATYTLSLEYSGPLHVYLQIRYANGQVSTPGTSIQYLSRTARGVDSITIVPENYPADAGATTKPVQIAVKLRAPGSAPVGTETRVYSAKLAPKVGTVLIEDGAVKAAQVDAESVAGAVGQFVQVKAANVEVTEQLSSRIVWAMSARARTLVVSEEAILQHTTLLGTTVADQLNVRKLLRGRDAILDGTVDINQLNVTGDMSARIINTATLSARQGFFTEGLTANEATLLGTTVAEKLVVTDTFSARVANAMDVNAKRLIVTDDAILNRATVVQSLVTPELIASKVDARYLRADNIKTGLLEVFGCFRTAPDGQPQIIIQPSQAAWNSKDLAVWFTPDGTTPGGGYASQFVVTGGMWMNPAGGGGRSESLWTPQQLNLRGQSRAGVRIMDGLTVQSTASTVGPTINTPNGQFLNIIGQGGVGITTLSGNARISPSGGIELLANNGNVYAESNSSGEVRLNGGTGGVRFTDQFGTAGQYSRTTGTAANMNMTAAGVLFRVTSALKYKTQVEEYTPDPGWLDLPVNRWKDKTALREAAELRERIKDREGPLTAEEQGVLDRADLWHVGTIADTAQDVAPHQVMRDINGEVDWYAYDRDGAMLRYFVRQQRDQISSLEQRVAQLEGAAV